MNRFALVAILIASAAPAVAGDCMYMGVPSSAGALICQAGQLSQCSQGRWLPQAKSCAPETILPQSAPPAAPAVMVAAAPFLLKILTANYTVGSVGTDVVFKLRALCEGKSACRVAGDAGFLQNDPAPGQRGHFSIKYVCSTGFRNQDAEHVVFAKGAAISLDCK
jgi:hypothetical protein